MKWLSKMNCSFNHPKKLDLLSTINPLAYAHRLTLSSLKPNSQILKALCANGKQSEALLEMAILGIEMKFEGYDTLLNACLNRRTIRDGQRVHAHMIKTCYLPPVYLRTRLIIFYNKCECLGDARQVFDEMREHNVVSWTAMISAYSQRGYSSEALNLFLQMLKSGILYFYYSDHCLTGGICI